jgi:hypothetical protein
VRVPLEAAATLRQLREIEHTPRAIDVDRSGLV